jgi:hypothetical protein
MNLPKAKELPRPTRPHHHVWAFFTADQLSNVLIVALFSRLNPPCLIINDKYKMSKYNSRKVSYEVNGVKRVFDSVVERDRYLYLKAKEQDGEISARELQKKFLLQDGYQRHKFIRPIHYISDFVYEENEQIIAEDVKGVKTDVYLLNERSCCLNTHA